MDKFMLISRSEAQDEFKNRVDQGLFNQVNKLIIENYKPQGFNVPMNKNWSIDQIEMLAQAYRSIGWIVEINLNDYRNEGTYLRFE